MPLEPVIDLTTFTGLKTMMGADYIGELIDAYLQETPEIIAQLQQALTENNAEVFRRTAHSIKSSSASFGALQFSAHAKELEMIGKEGHLDGAKEKVNQFLANYQLVAAALGALRNES